MRFPFTRGFFAVTPPPPLTPYDLFCRLSGTTFDRRFHCCLVARTDYVASCRLYPLCLCRVDVSSRLCLSCLLPSPAFCLLPFVSPPSPVCLLLDIRRAAKMMRGGVCYYINYRNATSFAPPPKQRSGTLSKTRISKEGLRKKTLRSLAVPAAGMLLCRYYWFDYWLYVHNAVQR